MKHSIGNIKKISNFFLFIILTALACRNNTNTKDAKILRTAYKNEPFYKEACQKKINTELKQDNFNEATLTLIDCYDNLEETDNNDSFFIENYYKIEPWYANLDDTVKFSLNLFLYDYQTFYLQNNLREITLMKNKQLLHSVKNQSKLASFYTSYGILLSEKYKNYDSAYRYYKKAQQIFRETKDTNNYIHVNNCIYIQYTRFKKYAEAKQIALLNLKLSEPNNDITFKGYGLLVLSSLYYNLGQIDSSNYYIDLTLKIDSNSLMNWYPIKIRNLLYKNNLVEAKNVLKNYNKYINSLVNATFKKRQYYEYLSALAMVKLKSKKYTEAELLMLKCLKFYNDTLQIESSTSKINTALSNLYKESKNYKKGYYHNISNQKFNDSIKLYTQIDNINTLIKQNELAEKENTILKKDIIIEKQKSNENRILLWSISGFLLLIVGILIFYYNFKKKQIIKDKRIQEQYSLNLLLNIESERNKLAVELHDSINQNLIVIKNKAVKTGDTMVEQTADNTIQDIRKIVRNLYPTQLQNAGFYQSVKDLLSNVENTSNLFVSYDMEEVQLPQERELHLFRIIQETINNILKHAKATAMRLELIKIENILTLSIKDNGVGFDLNQKLVNPFGVIILKQRAEALNGTINIISSINEGTSIICKFPI